MTALPARILGPLRDAVLWRDVRRRAGGPRAGWSVLAAVAATALTVAWAGSRIPGDVSPEYVGHWLFQVYQGVAHALGLAAGAAAAAGAFAPERASGAMAPLLLAAGAPRRLVRARLAGALAVAVAPLAALAPVGAVPAFFGGVSARVMACSLVSQVAVTALGASVGLALTVRSSTSHGARGLALVAATVVGALGWWVFGRGIGQHVCHHLGVTWHGAMWWPDVVAAPGVSLRSRAVVGAGPLVVAGLVATWLSAVAASRLDPAGATVATARRWYVAAAAAVTAAAVAAPYLAEGRALRAWVAAVAVAALGTAAVAATFVFQGDPVLASRRTRGGRWLARATGAGLAGGALLQLGVTAAALATAALGGWRAAARYPRGPALATHAPAWVAVAAMLFVLLAVGLGAGLRAWLGVRGGRYALAVVLGLVAAAPYPVAAVLGGEAGPAIVAVVPSPSPSFAFGVALQASRRAQGAGGTPGALAAARAALGYALAGAIGLAAAAAKARRAGRAVADDEAAMTARIAADGGGA